MFNTLMSTRTAISSASRQGTTTLMLLVRLGVNSTADDVGKEDHGMVLLLIQ